MGLQRLDYQLQTCLRVSKFNTNDGMSYEFGSWFFKSDNRNPDALCRVKLSLGDNLEFVYNTFGQSYTFVKFSVLI